MMPRPVLTVRTDGGSEAFSRGAVPGLGDEALFHDDIGEWAELIVRSGSHLLAVRMDIPKGKTAESIKPNTVELVRALLPKIR